MLKIPFLMRKLPSPRQFQFEPRYYDSIKESIKERKKWIKVEMKNFNNQNKKNDYPYHKEITFRHKKREERQVIGLRISIIILFLLLIWYFIQ